MSDDFESMLPPDAADILNVARGMFGDLFDNDDFGPFLEEFTNFGSDREAMLLIEEAIGQLAIYVPLAGSFEYTYLSYPYTLPVHRYCLLISLVICIITHLMRSYVEIPDTSRVNAPDVVRRDYLSRWQTILNEYKDKLKTAAKRLGAEGVDEQYASGQAIRTLVDFPSIASQYAPFNPAERPIYWGW